MSKQSINDTLYNEAITKLVNAGEEKITKHNSSLNNYYLDMVQATIDKGIELVGGIASPSEEQTDCDVVIDSMNDKSSKIDEDISEIKKDIEELKKRKKIKKVTRKKIKKKKVVDK